MIILWICIIFVSVFFIKYLLTGRDQAANASDILKKRCAAGKLSKEEFEEMKQDILFWSMVAKVTSMRRVCLVD